MKTSNTPTFNAFYQQHQKYLKISGLHPRTIESYSRAIRRIGEYCEGDIDRLSHDQLLDYFCRRLDEYSWSTVKIDLYGLRFFYDHVLKKTWQDIPLVKPPKVSRIPDILSINEVQSLFMSTRKLSYRVFFLPSTVWVCG